MSKRRQLGASPTSANMTESTGAKNQADQQLLDWDELHDWQQDNAYILSSYRPASWSYKKSLQSISQIHNEFVNIHSHLFGAVLFLALPFFTYGISSYRDSSVKAGDIIVFSTFFYGVATCFLLSSTFHIIANHSPNVSAFGNQLDYLGIVILMWGSTIPSVYYGFYCDPKLQKIYWSIVSFLAILCVIATINPGFRGPKFRPYRSLMYIGLGFSALGFVIHGLILYGWKTQNARMSLSWMAWMAAFNMIGAIAYPARVPERFAPGKFDIYGNSHQILHVMVIFAGLAHMFGQFNSFSHVHNKNFSC